MVVKFLSRVAITVVVISTAQARAEVNPYMDAANEQVRQAIANADLRAQKLVAEKSAEAIRKVFNRLAQLKDDSTVTKEISELKKIRTRFSALFSAYGDNSSQGKTELGRLITEYRDSYSNLFNATFRQMSALERYRFLPQALDEILQDLATVCKTGLADTQVNKPLSFGSPPPELQFDLQAYITGIPEEQFTNHNASSATLQTNYFDDKKQQSIGTSGAVAASLGITILANKAAFATYAVDAFGLKGTATASALSQAGSTVSIVGTTFLAVGVAVAVTMIVAGLVQSNQARAHMEHLYADAETSIFLRAPRAEYISKAFRTTCDARYAFTGRVQALLRDLNSSSMERSQIHEMVKAAEAEQTDWQRRLAPEACKLRMNEALDKNLCNGTKNDNFICHVRNGKAFNENCLLSLDRDERAKESQQAEKAVAKLIDTENAVLEDILVAFVAQTLTDDKEGFYDSIFKEALGTRLERQRFALNRLNAAIEAMPELFPDLNREVYQSNQARTFAKTYDQLDAKLRDLATRTFDVIFGEDDIKRWQKQYTALHSEILKFRSRLPNIENLLKRAQALQDILAYPFEMPIAESKK